jgi:voltage-gated potassium channel
MSDRPDSRRSEPENEHPAPAREDLRDRLYIIIFEAETPAGRWFDIALLVLIVISVVLVSLESVASIRAGFGTLFSELEWAFTGLFCIEYILRIYCARRRLRYIVSFFGIVDLLSLLPAFVSLFLAGAHSLIIIRSLRLLRVFRVLKIVRMLGEAQSLVDAIKASLPKILVFLGAVLIIVMIVGAAMHVIEGGDNGFTSVPRSMYWAIVTMTTVGYGDIAPHTPLGQAVSAALMIVGYGIIAVPTGIVSAELVGKKPTDHELICRACGRRGHLNDATFCRVCGTALD